MSNEIRSIASLNNFLEYEHVDIYKESDLMQQKGKGGTDNMGAWGDGFLYEEYLSGKLTDGVTFGFCINSYPFICRYHQREGYDPFRVHYSGQRDRDEYNRNYPVCGRGVAAYLMLHCKYDEEFGVCHYDSKGNMVKPQITFEEYLKLCRKVYYLIPDATGKTQYDRWKRFKTIGDVEALNRLEAEFLSQHREAEGKNRYISGEVDRRFFGGQLANVVAAYLKYVGDVEAAAGGHQEAQEADRWVISDDCLIVFGNRENAAAFLDGVIGKHYNITMYGKSMEKYAKKNGITRENRFGKLVWSLICDNDENMNPSSHGTFTRTWGSGK